MAAAVPATLVVTAATPATAVVAAAAAPPAVTGFTTIWGVTINPMVIVLAIAIAAVILLLWRAQRNADDPFDVLDLVMENSKASITKIAFLSAFVMTSWVVVDCQIKHTLTEGIFGLYLAAWVGPLVAKIVFNKSDMPKFDREGAGR
jgi:hypothetical protein